MIVYDLECQAGGHRFEGWFGSSDDYKRQQERGLVTCPQCGASDVSKAPMAPSLGRKGNQVTFPTGRTAETAIIKGGGSKGGMPTEAARMMQALTRMQAEALKDSRWVGDRFADESRAIYYGERDAEIIHGQATLEEARALIEEGIEVAPLPFPVAPPDKAN